ncbi:ABC transporter substrate-binding protein [Polynucleobacter tropicus]|uniref:ABC transporter substrate-binding protein n=1 Tax=Polynucleobacter tropicus TaxID=1743174 RepID=A0A6M9PR25_9BURK|nr:tripartite tricarboxylate transporter substrate binding protein [Polynucleobacter tropicus]QKM64970.1 ABC transporter substrate-binding protein [Polynucleobacter tropicus]
MNKKIIFGLVGLLSLLGMTVCLAENYPDRPVKIIVPYSAGGTADYSARQIAQKLTEMTKQSFFVENKTGASGTIATSYVAKAAPDGYTLLANDTTYAMLPSLFKTLPWNHAEDLEPIGVITQTPVVLVVPITSPYKTVAELIAFAKKNPGKLNYGSGGAGSSTHLSAEIFQQVADIDVSHVPYKGAGEAMLAVLSGQVDFAITAAPTAIAQLNGGKIRALAITGDKRIAAMKDVSTFKEAGLPAYKVSNWFGLAAPRDTPKVIIDKLAADMKKGLSDPVMKERFAAVGAEPGNLTPAEFKKFIKGETVIWGAAAKKAGLQPE